MALRFDHRLAKEKQSCVNLPFSCRKSSKHVPDGAIYGVENELHIMDSWPAVKRKTHFKNNISFTAFEKKHIN